ncbi:MAG TPA: LacI family DNA-binding transcriptional regulator [Solirubrobacteraceae bacterium]|nr:LacI family DNA-binding transcriptional regulator [Solirubrobacteraceae bacterium]
MRGATIAEVAQHAGVGVGTVSRVLNGSPAVSEPTRRRVLDSIAALDYRPNLVARALSTGRTMAVGVLAPFFTQPSVVERLRGVTRTLTGAGYEVVLFGVELPEQARERLATRAQRGRMDGILCVSLAPSDAEAARLEAARIPAVLIDRDHPRLPSVTIDDVEGGRMAARHLLRLGHRCIGFVGDLEDNPFGFASSARRREGFEAELAAAGVTPEPRLRFLCPHGRADARAAAAELLAADPRPTAVFASCDVQAIGVLEAAQAAGVTVPDELSVIGFDNVEAAGFTGLTTIAQPLEESGAVAAELLVRALAGEVVTSRRMPLALVERHSTAPAAVGAEDVLGTRG